MPAVRTRSGALAVHATPSPNATSFKAVGSYVPKVAAKCFARYGFHHAEIITSWRTIVGARLAEYTVPGQIKWPRRRERLDEEEAGQSTPQRKTSLEVRVDGARALNVQYAAPQIIDRINTYFGYRAITELRIMQGPIPRLTKEANRTGLPAEAAANAAKPVEAELDVVADPSLRAALVKLQAGVRHGVSTP